MNKLIGILALTGMTSILLIGCDLILTNNKAPDNPTNVIAVPGTGIGSIKISWNAPKNFGMVDDKPGTDHGYIITYWTGGSEFNNYKRITISPGATSYIFNDLDGGIEYSFRVRANNGQLTSSGSEIVTATPRSENDAPGAPTGLKANASGTESGAVTLTWNAPSSFGTVNGNNGTDKGYVVYWWTDATQSKKSITIASGTTEITLTGLTNGIQHHFYVTAKNESRDSDPSNTVSATPTRTVSVPEGFVYVPSGTFNMGSPSNDASAEDAEKPQHQVTVDPFIIGKYEVTWKQFIQFLNSANVSDTGTLDGNKIIAIDDDTLTLALNYTSSGVFEFQSISTVATENVSVMGVTWFGAVEYANWLSRQNNLTEVYTVGVGLVTANTVVNGYRLPTEAEWEFAARGGSGSKGYTYSGGNTADPVAWHSGNSGGIIHEGGKKNANELGIYDMSGNLWEWCWDWYGAYTSNTLTNPPGPVTGTKRILRGGAWKQLPQFARVANRNNAVPTDGLVTYGFRLALND